MNRLSKLTALLLALVLALGVPLQVWAESETIDTKSEYMDVADALLKLKIMAYTDYGEYWDFAKLIEESDFDEFFARLTEEEQKAMAEYVEAMFWDSLISYTRVAPLPEMEEVQTASALSVQARDGDTATVANTADNGLYTNKTVSEPDVNGYYTITLENYATGKVTTSTTTKTLPVDIVLVLDFSNSMSQSFDGSGGGGGSSSSSNSKIVGLQTAVNNFIQSVNDNYTDEGNHRISLITYNTTATVQNGWTYVTDANVSELQISDIERDDWQSSGTNTHLGLSAALTQLNNSSISGSTVTRQKVVILFTDGVPGTSRGEFDVQAAVSAITNAKSLKDMGATVYSVAVLTGADPLATIDTTATTEDTQINAMLHAISSNYEEATASYNGDQLNTSLGDFNDDIDTDNNNALSDGEDSYYIAASSATELNNIFQQISSNVQSGSSSVTLDETTIVRDVVTPYFEIPYVLNDDGTKDYAAAEITIYEAQHTGDDADGNPLFGTPTEVNYSYTVDGNVLDVTGFDFADNAVMTLTNNGVTSYVGKKLIITFKIKTVDGFLGGNDVVTNTSDSGIWEKQDDGTYTEFEAYPIPDVNVQVPPLKIVGEDQHIYLGNNASLDDLLQSFSVYYDIMDDDGATKVSGRHKVDSILNHYVQLDFTLYLDVNKDGEVDSSDTPYAYYSIDKEAETGKWTYNEVVSDSLSLAFTDDVTQFVISYTATASSSNLSTGSMTANIYVYKPEVTFQDTTHSYLEEVTAGGYYDSNNYVADSLKWYNTTLSQYSTEAMVINPETDQEVSAMLGTAPTLTYTYAPASNTWITDGKVTGTTCVPVNVTEVLIDGENDITINATTNANSGYLKTTRIVQTCTTCSNKDGIETSTDVTDSTLCEFVVHIKNAYSELRITKSGLNVGESAIFTVTGYVPDGTANGKKQTWTIVLTATVDNAVPSATITGLLVNSTATVKEAGEWSWRYSVTTYSPGDATVTIVPKTATGYPATVTITNSGRTDQWLSDESSYVNEFTTVSTENAD